MFDRFQITRALLIGPAICSIFTTAAITPPTTASADTLGRYMPVANQVMVSLYRGGQSSDSDARAFFEMMNVPTQQTFLGIGKSIDLAGQSLSLVCADRATQGFQCTILFRQSSRTKMQVSPLAARLELSGREASDFKALMEPEPRAGDWVWEDTSQILTVKFASGTALVQFSTR